MNVTVTIPIEIPVIIRGDEQSESIRDVSHSDRIPFGPSGELGAVVGNVNSVLPVDEDVVRTNQTRALVENSRRIGVPRSITSEFWLIVRYR